MTTMFTPDHEWINIEDHEAAVVGITLHAQDALGDVVFVDLPEVGRTYKKGEVAGVVESVKAAADIYMPVTGEVVEVNEALRADPALANSDPMGNGWFFKVHVTTWPSSTADGPAGLRRAAEDALTPARTPPMLMSALPPLPSSRTPPSSPPATSARRADEAHMLSVIGAASRRALIDAIVPRSIARSQPMDLPPPATEAQALAELKAIAAKNRVLKSFIGQGYHGTHTPGVILRNILENPAWYTAYTPYQAEISQGRMEALVNFQTMVCDLTGMAIANAQHAGRGHRRRRGHDAGQAQRQEPRATPSWWPGDCHPQTIEVIQTRAAPLGLRWWWPTRPEWDALMAGDDYFAVLVQYPPPTADPRLRADAAHARASRPPSSWPPTCWR
jgi:glycine cleavage system H protein